MRWAVNVRKKTLTISLSSWETMELFIATKRAVWAMGEDVPSILHDRLGRVVRDALGVMFPQAFPGKDPNDWDCFTAPEQVDLEAICDED